MGYVEKEISLSYKFDFPAVIVFKNYGGKILAIAREEGNWIVLENETQKLFFECLNEMTIEKAIKQSCCSFEEAEEVVTQIIARHFEKKVRYQKTNPIMQLYLTNKCNMCCPHCYMYAGEESDDEMTTDEVKDVLKAYRANGGRDVKMTGGEIALRKDLHEIVKYGKDLGLKIDLLTNGTLWTASAINEITPYINSVQISIDGYNEDENAKVRGKGNFNKALAAVDMFARANNIVKVAITANYTNDIEEKISPFADFAKSLKEKYSDYKVDVDIATGLLPGRYGKLSTSEDNKYRNATLAMNNRYLGCNNIKDAAYIKRHRSGIVLTNCSYGFPTIAANGDLHFCPVTMMTTPVANIRTTPLDEVMQICQKVHSYSDTSNLEPCKDCELKSICGGDCRLNFPCFQKSDLKAMEKPVRQCSEEIKSEFYEIMLRTNEDIFH